MVVAFPLSGTVYEATQNGRVPVPGVEIDISVEYQSASGPNTTTDGAGRFAVTVTQSNVKIIATKPGYSQPCRVPVPPGASEQDVYLVSNALLSTTGVPATMAIVHPTLTGRVTEQTAGGLQPVAGAQVTGDFTGGLGWAPSATTQTGARRAISPLQRLARTGLGLELLVSKPGYVDAAVSLIGQPTADVDVEIARR